MRDTQGRGLRRRLAKFNHGVICDIPNPISISILSIRSFSSVQFRPPLVSVSLSLSHLISSIISIRASRPIRRRRTCTRAFHIRIHIQSGIDSPIVLYLPLNAECSLCLDDCPHAVDAHLHTTITITRSHSRVVHSHISILRPPVRSEGPSLTPSVRSRFPKYPLLPL